MKMKLVFIWLSCMKNFYIRVFHSNSKPITRRTVTQTKYLTAKVMLLQLSALSKIPRSDSVVKTPCPKFISIRRDVNTTGTISVSLEQSDKCLVVKIPYCNVTITATTEADFRV